jgi:uncharacterized protein YndB with AHSA1/START domain
MDDKHWIIVTAEISATLDQVWEKWTQGAHVVNWNFAHHSWCCPRATSDFKVGGISSYRMEAKDGSMGFDLNATFTQIEPLAMIASVLEDGRKVEVRFTKSEKGIHIEQRFEPESQNSRDLQQMGWQAILDQFKTYCEQ